MNIFKLRVVVCVFFAQVSTGVFAETAIHNCTGLSARVNFPEQWINMTVVPGVTELNMPVMQRVTRVSAVNVTPLTSGTEEVSVIEPAVRNWVSNHLIINSEDTDASGGYSRESFSYADNNGQTFRGAMVYSRVRGSEQFIGVSNTNMKPEFFSGVNTTASGGTRVNSSKPFAGGVFTVAAGPYITFINGRNISFPVQNKNRTSKFNVSIFISFDNWVTEYVGSYYGVQSLSAQYPVVYELSGTCTYQAPVLSWRVVPDEINFNNVALGSPSALSTFTIQQNPGGGLAEGTFRADFSVVDSNKQHIAIGDSYATVEFPDVNGGIILLEAGKEYKLTNENQKMDVRLYPVGKQPGQQIATVNFTFTYN